MSNVGIYSHKVRDIRGNEVSMESYRGKVLLIVNVASQCGFAPQYKGLQKIYETYRSRGLEILGFPCNQFGGQEPGAEQEIQQTCEINFGVSFPLFSKIDVNGENSDPLFRFLKSEAKGFLGSKSIKWNFTKFLVDRNGKVVKRFGSTTTPDKIIPKIEKLLN